MKKRRGNISQGVGPCDVGMFVGIATSTGERKVALIVCPAVHQGYDVLNVELVR